MIEVSAVDGSGIEELRQIAAALDLDLVRDQMPVGREADGVAHAVYSVAKRRRNRRSGSPGRGSGYPCAGK
jgi:hypothetical protein